MNSTLSCVLRWARQSRAAARNCPWDGTLGEYSQVADQCVGIALRQVARWLLADRRALREDCDHGWEDDWSHETERSLEGRIIESWHAGSRTCRECGLRERIEKPCDCAEPEKRDSGLCQCRGERCNC